MGKFIGTFDSGGYAVDVFREREVQNVAGVTIFGDDVGEGFEDERTVSWGGEDCDGEVAEEEEASELEDGDCVAFGHEGE